MPSCFCSQLYIHDPTFPSLSTVTVQQHAGRQQSVWQRDGLRHEHSAVRQRRRELGHQSCDGRALRRFGAVDVRRFVRRSAVVTDNVVLRGDYTRVLAEFWADGPQSETPPGHWNTIALSVLDHPAFEYRWGGVGALMDPIEYEVKLFLALNGALHDAAIVGWGLKRKYDSIRPVSALRYMAGFGQSSDKSLPAYHPLGLPLIRGHIRVVKPEDVWCVGLGRLRRSSPIFGALSLANCGNYTREGAVGWTPGVDSELEFGAINRTVIRAWCDFARRNELFSFILCFKCLFPFLFPQGIR